MKKIHKGFWEKLPRPIYIQAPMADVTDSAFRHIIAKQGSPHVFFTEFVSADGLMHPKGRERLLIDLKFEKNEHPIVAQLFSSNPEKMHGAVKLCAELGFDGVDINMGCPDRTIEKQGCGSAMIKTPSLAKEIIAAAKEAAHSTSSGQDDLPISVKSRIGYNSLDEFDEWMQTLLDARPALITMHLRTRKEMSRVPAHWELASRLREITHHTRTRGSTSRPGLEVKEGSADGHPLLVANGDVMDLDDARSKAKEHNLDGIMLGRAIYGNPWLYSGKRREDLGWRERLGVMLEHTKLFQEDYIDEPISEGKKPYKSFMIMRKFYGAYLLGHPQAKELRSDLNECNNAQEVEKVIDKFMV